MVDVALVVVALTPVKFWRVEEPWTKRFEVDAVPKILAREIFGSKKNLAVEVPVTLPIVTTSVELRG